MARTMSQSRSMAHSYRDLIVWQLARELRLHVIRMTSRRPVPIDRDFVRDIRRSVRSVASNTAEGHNRFRPKENHRFLEIAKASLAETEGHLDDGFENNYFTKAEYAAAHLLVRRITPALASLMRYLRSLAAEANFKTLQNRSDPPKRQKPSSGRNPSNE
jgi:four helix bundle protein